MVLTYLHEALYNSPDQDCFKSVGVAWRGFIGRTTGLIGVEEGHHCRRVHCIFQPGVCTGFLEEEKKMRERVTTARH